MPQMEMEQNLDFAQYGQMLRMSEEGYRQQEILRIVRELPENSMIRRVLDVGCAAGLLGLAVIGDGRTAPACCWIRFHLRSFSPRWTPLGWESGSRSCRGTSSPTILAVAMI